MSQPKVTLAEESEAALPLLPSASQSRLEFQLYYLKTAMPSAQGGYGLATLGRSIRLDLIRLVSGD